ncbi:MAG: sigma factor, partial [Planctomycetota bacterium]|nr:sigma factor [Planctomycetota bacterium]
MTEPNQNGWLGLALERHEASLVRYAYRLLRDSELARDVAQDYILRLCKQRRDRVEDHVKEWLFTVCRNR